MSVKGAQETVVATVLSLGWKPEQSMELTALSYLEAATLTAACTCNADSPVDKKACRH